MNPNLLSQEADIVHALEKIGLSSEETQVYLSLLKNGPQTVVQLHKRIGLGRNVAYRILDQLLAKQIIEQQLGPRGIIYAAKPATQLKQIVTEKIAQLEATQKELPNLIDKIEAIKSVVPDSRVVYYEGIEGLKQVSYNITRAKDLLRVFEVDHLSEFIPAEFAEKIREELVANKIQTRDLTNKTEMTEYTQVTELITSYSQVRYVNPQLLTIDFEVLIYNDVYATYTYKDNKIFCVEIYHEQLAQMQKQIFDFVWKQAQPLEYTNQFGAARLVANQ